MPEFSKRRVTKFLDDTIGPLVRDSDNNRLLLTLMAMASYCDLGDSVLGGHSSALEREGMCYFIVQDLSAAEKATLLFELSKHISEGMARWARRWAAHARAIGDM